MTRVVEKEYKSEIVEIERIGHNEATIMPMSNMPNIVVDKVEINTKALEELLSSNDIEYTTDCFADCSQITVEGWSHKIYISIDEEGYFLSTLNEENKKYYSNDEDKYKNQTTRKKAKSVLTYINKYL